MSSLLKFFGLLLLVSVATCVPSRISRDISNLDIDLNELTPPQDPAINNFPKAPVVPIIPNCEHAGFFRDPFNCGKFYHCQRKDANPITFYCIHGLIFNEQTEMCDEPQFVDC